MAQAQGYLPMPVAEPPARYPNSVAVARRPVQEMTVRPSAAVQCSNPLPQKYVATPDLWAAAVQSYSPEDQLYLEPLKTVHPRETLESLENVVFEQQKRYEAHQKRFVLRGQEYVLRDVAGKTLKWIDKYKALGDTLAGMQPIYAGIPWAGFKWLMSMSIDSADSIHALVVGLEKVSWLIDRCRVYELLYLSCAELDAAQGQPKDHLQMAIQRLYVLVLGLMMTALKRYKKKRGWKKIRHVAFPLTKADIEDLISSCEHEETQVEKWVMLCNNSISNRQLASIQRKMEGCGSLFGQIHALVKESNNLSRQIFERVESQRRQDILHWVSVIPCGPIHQAAKSDRTKGTGLWLLKHQQYQEWRQSNQSSVFWLQGYVGVGKTKLVSTVVDEVLPLCETSCGTYGVAYFYCDRNQDDRNTYEAILASLVRQLVLLVDNDHLSTRLCKLYEVAEASGNKDKLTPTQLQDLLVEQLQHFSESYVILDALDECSEQCRQRLLLMLQTTIQTVKKPVKLFASSRPEQDIKDLIRSLRIGRSFTTQAGDNVSDIDTHVRAVLDNPPVYNWGGDWLDAALREEIRSALVHGGEGMFQWVTLQLQELFELRGRHAVEQRLRNLKKLPKHLKAAYDEIFKSIQNNTDYFRVANRAFCWMMVSYQGMSKDTLLEAVSQDPDSDRIQDVSVTIKELEHACRHLIHIDNSDVWRFTHLSVREYLEDVQCTSSEAHATIASICLTKLAGPDIPTIIQGEERPFYDPGICDYIAYTWPYHLQDIKVFQIRRDLAQKLCKFLGTGDTSTNAYRQWLRSVYDGMPIVFRRNYFVAGRQYLLPSTSPLPMVVALGLEKPLNSWWRLDPFPLNYRNKAGHTLLQIAARSGNFSSVQLLISKGADINESSGSWVTPLQAACSIQNIELVRFFLQHKADVNVKDATRGSAIHSACSSREGSLEIFKLLVAHGADIHAPVGLHGTPLHAASKGGAKILVEELLVSGADVNANAGQYGTPLHAACAIGHRDIAELLLKHKADVHARNAQGMTLADVAQRDYTQAVRYQERNHDYLADVHFEKSKWITELFQKYGDRSQPYRMI